MIFLTPGNPDDAREDRAELDTEISEAGGAAVSGKPRLTRGRPPTGRRSGAEAGAPGLAGAAGSGARVECQACRERECSNFNGLGLNVVQGCLKSIDSSQGADGSDPDFVADCTAAVNCAVQSHCAESVAGPARCYCGSRSVDDCIEKGPAADAPCVEQWKRATRTQSHDELTYRFSDLKYPSGWAHFLIECDRLQCRSNCMPGADRI